MTLPEGPLCEFTGYYASQKRPAPVMQVTAMHPRDAPILLGSPPMKPPRFHFGLPLRAAASGRGRALRLQFGMGVKRGLVLPQFEQDQLVEIGDALEHLELFAAGILPRDLAARLHRLREFVALARSSERGFELRRHFEDAAQTLSAGTC